MQFNLRGDGKTSVLTGDFLGDAQLVFDNQALLEFALKMYHHLGLPLQRLAVLWPFAHENALQGAWELLSPLALRGEGPVTKAELMALAENLAALPEEDNAFYFWTLALGAETGYDETLRAAFAGLPAWVEEHIPEEGLTVTRSEDSADTWEADGVPLARVRQTADEAEYVLRLPALVGGADLAFSASRGAEGRGELHLSIGEEGALLQVDINADGLQNPAGAFRVSLRLSGEMAGHLSAPVFDDQGLWRAVSLPEAGGLALDIEGGANTIKVRTGGHTLLTVQYALTDVQPDYDFIPLWVSGDAIHLFMLADASFADFISRISRPAFSTLIPVIAELPASFVSAVMDLADSAGVMSMLSGEEDSGWEEDEWDEEWDEEWNEEWSEDWNGEEDWEGGYEDSDY